MALQVSGKTALVTGGGSGICLEFTKLLLSHNCNVLVADLALRPEAEAVITGKALAGGKARAVFKKTDVTDWNELQAAFDEAVKEFGEINIVCPGAGVFEPTWSNFWRPKTSIDTTATSTYKTLEINITHPIRCTQLAISVFLSQSPQPTTQTTEAPSSKGVVVLISSIAAQAALPVTPLYCASKAAISSFCRSVGYLEQMLGVRVNAVAPGVVKTPIWTEDKLRIVDEERDTWITPERIAEVMLELVQEEKNVGGTVLEVGAEEVRSVERLMDPGPKGKGHDVSNAMGEVLALPGIIREEFAK